MGWLRRKEREPFRPPPPPTPEEIEQAAEMLRRAEDQLQTVNDADPEVSRQAEHLEEVRRVNHIGPQFWDAVGIRRKRA